MTKKKKIGKKSSSLFIKIIISFFIILVISGSYTAYRVYRMIYQPNVVLHEKKKQYMYIPSGSEFKDVVRILTENNLIRDVNSFEWVAEKKKYIMNIKPGRYRIRQDMNNNELVNLLRAGLQTPVNITLYRLRTKEQLAGRISTKMEPDSLSVLEMLNDREFLQEYDLTPATVLCMFIPNTYEFYWNTSVKEFFTRMNKEYENFWTEKRKKKATLTGLSRTEISILASIVELETIKNDEKAAIAGVYINRLKKGMRLQADPTVIYAAGDFTVKRVKGPMLDIDSPYNTYMYAGLPPGPIIIPSVSSLDEVLSYEKHKYLYFCAKEDFSGYHSFAETYAQHKLNARKYQKMLNKKNITY